MIRVHVWDFRGLKTAMGHASMHVRTEYISWWPDGTGRDFKLPGSVGQSVPLYSVNHIHGQSFDDDKILEGYPGPPLAPHHSIMLDGLDENGILSWWKRFNSPGRKWSTLGQNCATTVGRALMVGGADDFALGLSGWHHSWNVVWQPNDVLRYAKEVQSGLTTRRGRRQAITFVRRFCKSPLGFTSITMNMNEQAMAQAIYGELGTNTKLIRQVFLELDERRNTDADDVAEIYVKLLKTKKGAPLAAVRKDEPLKKILIKVLQEGSVSAGEQKCIDFVQSLK